MPTARDVRNPIATTYLSTSTMRGRRVVHARLYSPEYGLDHRGTGTTVDEARSRALATIRTSSSSRRG